MLGEDELGRQLGPFVGVVVCLVARLFAQTLCLSLQQDGAVCLWQAEESDGGNGEGPDGLDVFCPAPSEVRIHRQRGADDGALGDVWSAKVDLENSLMDVESSLTRVGPPTTHRA